LLIANFVTLKRTLHINALITSPIIALYGVSPFYIFKQIDFSTFLLVAGGTTLSIYLTWLIHIYFEFKFPRQNKVIRFLLTYLVNIAFRLPFVLYNPGFLAYDKYHAFPIITSLVLNAIIMVIVHSVVTGYKKSEMEMQLQELKWQNVESQKQVLMQQLQPHFLFNALSTLKSLIKEDPSIAETYTLRLSEFLRYTIVAPREELVTVEREVQFVRDYIGLQTVRFGNAVQYEIAVDESLLQKKLPVLALQILTENIFKHNQFNEKRPLRFSIKGQGESIVVWNEKHSPAFIFKSSTGLSNLSSRYNLLGEKGIDVKEGNTEFIVTIPTIDK